MSKSSLIAVLALIASASAKPYIYTLPARAAYTDFYNSAVSPLAAYSGYPAAYSSYPTAYSSAYSTTYPASYSAAATALSGSLTYPASLTSPTYYTFEDLSSLVNPAPVAPVSPVASILYGSPYSYLYKR